MINLFNSKLVKEVQSSSPQRDGFELENLIENSDNNSDFFKKFKSNGFVSDSFIRPPVTIQIMFNDPVRIESIILDAKVNTQKSTGFTISSSIEPISSFTSAKTRSDIKFCQIAKILNDKTPQNSVYEFLKKGQDYQKNENINKCFFNTKSLDYLNRVTALQITITRTLSSTSPCIKSIKIFGHSEKSTDLQEKKTPEQQLKKILVPEEFIDVLTNEMMRMPVKLPSNKHIDQSTLDKYIAEKKKNNVEPSDPFTCKKFDSNYKPIFDEKLKSKIDKFLFDNSGCVFEFDSSANKSQMEVPDKKLKRKYEGHKMNAVDIKRRRDDSKCDSCFNVQSEDSYFNITMFIRLFFSFFVSFALFNSIRTDRQVSVLWNPECSDPRCKEPSENGSFVNLVYVKLTGQSDIVHLMYSNIQSFTIMIFKTSPNAKLILNWEKLLSQNSTIMKDSIKFSEKPIDFGGYEIPSIFEFIDYNGNADMRKSNETYTYLTRDLCWKKFVSNESAGVLEAFVPNMNGSYKFLINYPGKEERIKVLPHLLLKPESSSVEFQIDSVAPKSKYSKFGTNIVFLTDSIDLSVSSKRTIDDEYTPGTFRLWNAQTLDNAKKSRNYLQWKPIFYYSDPKSLENSTITQQYDSRSNDEISSGLGQVFYGEQKLFTSMNISFGLEGNIKDGYFYKQTNFSSWAFSVGLGAAPDEKMSPVVTLVIFIGFGLPALAIVIGLLVMLVKKIKGRSQYNSL
ncbi:glycosylated lysosomal membrane A-like [Brachionus plicatilis]|uniref:Glycosylated lysosomal membrane A-like n=1 Tax=Brachionus plicatilis TaxID=10195 RepID=A0A3M7P9U6_BRAPC|nr:glycosylated lysosomal membrane A-like [Brachionus plicatilis]